MKKKTNYSEFRNTYYKALLKSSIKKLLDSEEASKILCNINFDSKDHDQYFSNFSKELLNKIKPPKKAKDSRASKKQKKISIYDEKFGFDFYKLRANFQNIHNEFWEQFYDKKYYFDQKGLLMKPSEPQPESSDQALPSLIKQ